MELNRKRSQCMLKIYSERKTQKHKLGSMLNICSCTMFVEIKLSDEHPFSNNKDVWSSVCQEFFAHYFEKCAIFLTLIKIMCSTHDSKANIRNKIKEKNY